MLVHLLLLGIMLISIWALLRVKVLDLSAVSHLLLNCLWQRLIVSLRQRRFPIRRLTAHVHLLKVGVLVATNASLDAHFSALSTPGSLLVHLILYVLALGRTTGILFLLVEHSRIVVRVVSAYDGFRFRRQVALRSQMTTGRLRAKLETRHDKVDCWVVRSTLVLLIAHSAASIVGGPDALHLFRTTTSHL